MHFQDSSELVKWGDPEKMYQALFDSMLNGLAYCRMIFQEDGQPEDFVYLAVNEAFYLQTGLKDVIGKRITEVLPTIRETDPAIFATYSRVATTGQPERFEMQVEALRMWFSVSVYSPAKGDFVAVFDVITKRKQDQAALQETEARYRTLFEESPVGLWLEDFSEVKRALDQLRASGVADLRGHLLHHPEVTREWASLVRILEVNRASVELLGLAPKEGLVHDLSNYFNPSSLEAFAEEVCALAEGQTTFRGETSRKRATGETRWIDLSISVQRGHEQDLSRVLVTFLDITARKQSEDERRDLQAKIQEVQRMESLGNLAGGVAHDMNNVLGAILALSSAHLELQPNPSGVHQAFETISQAAIRGREMVQRLLNLARRTPAIAQEVVLNSLLREQVQLLERTTLSRLQLELALADDLLPVLGDASALAHAFMNLCINALDAMPDRGTLTLRTRNLANGWVEATVEDTGCGMPPSVRDQALDPYFTTKPEGKGTGLGLPLVYSTVKAHRGELEIASEPGQGTRVTLRFPACQPSAAPQPFPSAPSPRQLQVMLVDDDELIQQSTGMLLECLGHVVTPLSSGEAAMMRLEAGFEPDVVILDMNMPGLGGAGTLPRLRQQCPDLPVLLATGRPDQAALDLVAAHPPAGLLSKPFSVQELQAGLIATVRRSPGH